MEAACTRVQGCYRGSYMATLHRSCVVLWHGSGVWRLRFGASVVPLPPSVKCVLLRHEVVELAMLRFALPWRGLTCVQGIVCCGVLCGFVLRCRGV